MQTATGTLWCSRACFIAKDELRCNKIREDTYVNDAAGMFIQQPKSDATASVQSLRSHSGNEKHV